MRWSGVSVTFSITASVVGVALRAAGVIPRACSRILSSFSWDRSPSTQTARWTSAVSSAKPQSAALHVSTPGTVSSASHHAAVRSPHLMSPGRGGFTMAPSEKSRGDIQPFDTGVGFGRGRGYLPLGRKTSET